MNIEEVIAQHVIDHLNAWEDKPCAIKLEFPKRNTGNLMMIMSPLSGTVIGRSYIDGSFVGNWPFAVYVRISSVDSDKRMTATGILNALGDWLISADLPVFEDDRYLPIKFEMTSYPSVSMEYDDGTTDYQAIYSLKYRKRV